MIGVFGGVCIMTDDYFVDMDEFLSLFDCADDKDTSASFNKFDSFESYSLMDYYARYGVDNDFDLAEAMYEDYSSYTGNLVRVPWFVDFRVRCALNPEYTEKCLESEAFQDVRDEILERLKHV